MIFHLVLCLPIMSRGTSCQKRRCHSNQIDTSEELIIDHSNKGYSCWYKYHLWTKGQQKFAVLTDNYGEFQTVANFAFTVTINNQMAIHQFEYKNSTVWDQQLIAPLKEDQDAWHFLSLSFQNSQIQIQIYFNNELYTGTNIEFFFVQINIADIPYQPHALVIVCQSYQKSPSLEFLQKCNDDLEQVHTLNYEPDILSYYGNEFNVQNALVNIWLMDQQSNSYFSLVLRQQTILGLFESMITLKKYNQSFQIGFFDWNDTLHVNIYFNITSQTELQQWYFLYIDHSKETYLQTITNIYQTSQTIVRQYPNAQLHFQIFQTSFSDLIINDIKSISCPPSCEACNLMACTKCHGNRHGPDCSCPLYQIDYGKLNCEFPYKIRPFDIKFDNRSCPTGYLRCSEKILCDHGYIEFQSKCFKCPNLGNEVCHQCLTQVGTTDSLNCVYTHQENLIRYKTHQITDFMSFFQQRSYYDEAGQYFTLDLASVNIMYEFVNDTILPILKAKNSDGLVLQMSRILRFIVNFLNVNQFH